MPRSITVPRLGWSMEEGNLGEWLMEPGQYVKAGDMLFVLEGEKAAQEIEALDSGYLYIPSDAPQAGSTVKVGQVIGFLLQAGETGPPSVNLDGDPSSITTVHSEPASSALSASVTAKAPSLPLRVAGPAARRLARQLGIDMNVVDTPDPTGRVITADLMQSTISAQQHRAGKGPLANASRVIATPRARRRAVEFGIDWKGLQGTGRGGRIRESDVIKAQFKRSANQSTQQPTSQPAPTVPGQFAPTSKLRRVIAQRMQAAVSAAAPVTLMKKIDADPLVLYRRSLKSNDAQQLPSYNDIILSSVAQALLETPDMNACWCSDSIYHYAEVHIAIAVDTTAGLLAPVVRHADRMSLSEIAMQTRQLIDQARSGQLKQEQLTGATFTLSNLGMFGIDAFTPLLNLPQAAILGIGRILEEPVVRAGRIEIGQTMTLSLTFDHRVIDGAPAARWLEQLCTQLSSLHLLAAGP